MWSKINDGKEIVRPSPGLSTSFQHPLWKREGKLWKRLDTMVPVNNGQGVEHDEALPHVLPIEALEGDASRGPSETDVQMGVHVPS